MGYRRKAALVWKVFDTRRRGITVNQIPFKSVSNNFRGYTPTPEWGTMLSDVLQFAQSAWWVVTFPGLAILLTVLAFNLMGDGLRDALDPKLKQ